MDNYSGDSPLHVAGHFHVVECDEFRYLVNFQVVEFVIRFEQELNRFLVSNLQLRNSRPNGGRHRLGCHFLIYSIYAWGVPTLIVAVGQILDYAPNLPDSIIKPNFGVTHCWFKGWWCAVLNQIY